MFPWAPNFSKGIMFLGNPFITENIYTVKEIQNQNSRILMKKLMFYIYVGKLIYFL